MDTQDFFSSCKSGDLEKVRFLVERRDVEVKARDIWDSTPLYYACLCGHLGIVEFLISVGANCEANTFDGERCLYGALTDDIRRTLTQHRLITPHTMRRNFFNEFLRRLYESEENSDFKLVGDGKQLNLHRCILTARSPYFANLFSGQWRYKTRVIMKTELVPWAAFEAVMRYIYTGKLECALEIVDECRLLAKKCQLPKFQERMDKALTRANHLLSLKSKRVSVTRLVIDSDNEDELNVDLRELGHSTLPLSMRVCPTHKLLTSSTADICFVVQGHRFMCHQVIFIQRSDYFRALLQDHFNEADEESTSKIPVLTLHQFTAPVFAVVALYVYSNQALVDVDNATELLHVSNMYLMPDLRRLVGVFLAREFTVGTVLDVLQLSRVFNLLRLEDQCVAFMAKHFIEVSQLEELRDFISSDASAVVGRQETDSVTIIDELRFHISAHLKTQSHMQEAQAKLVLLEQILQQMDIQA